MMAVRTRCLSMARGFDLITGQTETALASGIRGKCLLELRAIEIRPQDRREMHLGVGKFPQQEIADALLASGADEKIRLRRAGQTEKKFDACFRHSRRI